MPDRALIPLPGIGTLSLSRAEYEAALIPIATPEATEPDPKSRAVVARPSASIATQQSERPRGLRYLRLPDVCERVGLRPPATYRLIRLWRFPKPVKISERASRWVESELETFMAQRVSKRDQHAAAPTQRFLPAG